MQRIRDNKGLIFCILFICLTASSFLGQEIYAATVPYASLVIFAVLGLLALPELKEAFAAKDPDLFLAVGVLVATPVCMVLSSSGYGAFFIPADLALICFMAVRIRLTERQLRVICIAGAATVILWYSHVRWSYNFNMAGFAFMLISFFTMIILYSLDIPYKRLISIFSFVTAFILATLYHSRTAMAGLTSFLVFYLLYGFMRKSRGLYYAVVALLTAGGVGFTALYILLSSVLDNARILNKDIFSGREEIWREIWDAFLDAPLYGIGSAFKLKSLGIFEVHNGMFDILAVHGIIVLVLILVMLVRMFIYIREKIRGSGAGGSAATSATMSAPSSSAISAIALSAAFAMMFASFFENFFIVPPYSIFFMAFILIAVSADATGTGSK